MKITAELPVSILASFNNLLDYDFIIASHCLNHPEYLQFYTSPREHPETSQRFSILDNGAFEEGKAIDAVKYRDLIQQLNPNVIVLPDVLNDMQNTLDTTDRFLNEFGDILSSFSWMGVLQGESYKEYMQCYEFYTPFENISLIGIPYHRFYRPKLITDLRLNDVCEANGIYLHMLGLSNPFEIRDLRQFDMINSLDTSLPVTSGKCFFQFEDLNWQKLKLNMADTFDSDQLTMIKKNIEFLKKITK